MTQRGAKDGFQEWMALLLSIAAIVAAAYLTHFPLFERFSFVVSDEISRKLGASDAEHVALVQINRSFSKSDLQQLLSHAIPVLVSDYHVEGLGVDIDFSEGGYAQLAKQYSKSSAMDPRLDRKVVWAVGYQNEPLEGQGARVGQPDAAACEDCSGLSCRARVTPKPVFESKGSPKNYGLAIAFADLDGVNRSSVRFVCHPQSENPLRAFHFKLVEAYCEGRSQMVTCRELQHNKQARTTIYSWYRARPIQLCDLVRCQGELGTTLGQVSDQLAGKVVILYSDTKGNDEHMTMMGSQKGAEIVASLIENELQFGVAPQWHVSLMKWIVEAIITLVMIILFHWRYTRFWAFLPAGGVFVLYLHCVPKLAAWVPDFRNYVFAIIVTFTFELLLKLGWNLLASGTGGGTAVHAARCW